MTILQKYDAYLRHFSETVTVGELADPSVGGVALRHDVDHDLDVALEMARFEYDRGIRATYFVLHTAPYWQDVHLTDKLLQLQDYGHEVGIHINVLSEWMRGAVDDPAGHLGDLLAPLRNAGVRITGMSAHGDQICYSAGFINYWGFAELRPDDPASVEDGRTAEGPFDRNGRRRVHYPAGHEIVREGGARLPLWSMSMREFGLAYDAWHVPSDGYFSDSGGAWTRTSDPLDEDLGSGRHQVLIHPVHWRGPPRTYFFLSPARSGSTWLANFLERATPVKARHEYMLNQDFHDGERAEKRTGTEFAALAEDRERATALIADAWTRRERVPDDYAEVNVYLEAFVDIVRTYFPDAVFVMLQRDPQAVVRSLLGRNWYDSPLDPHHRRIDVPDWEQSGQFARVCHYVADVHRRLSVACRHRIQLESASANLQTLTGTLEEIGIVVHPRLAARVHADVVNATAQHRFPTADRWSAAQRATFERICGPIARQHRSGGLISRARQWLSWLRPAVNRRPPRQEPQPPRAGDVVLLEGAGVPETGRWHLSGFLVDAECRSAVRIVPDPARAGSHRHLVIGGSHWNPGSDAVEAEMPGWASLANSFLAGRVRANVADDGQVSLFALSFDGKGEVVHRRRLGVLSSARGELEFACRLRADVARFDLALYASKDSVPSSIGIERIALTLKPLSEGYAALA